MPTRKAYIPPGRRLRFERLGTRHFHVLAAHPELFSGPHRKRRGGAWTRDGLWGRLTQADDDLNAIKNEQLPSGHFWLVFRGEAPVSIVGFYWDKFVFVHCMHAPRNTPSKTYLSPSDMVEVIKRSVEFLKELEPDQLCAIASVVDTELYERAEFICTSNTRMRRLPRADGKKTGSSRDMSLMVVPLRAQPLAAPGGA